MNRKLITLAKRASGDSNLVAVPLPFDSQGALHEIWVGAYEAWSNRYVTIGPNASLPDPAKARLRGAFVRRSLATTSLRIQRSQYRLVERMRDSAIRSVRGVPRAARILDAADLGFDFVAQPPGERGLRLHVHPPVGDMETAPVCSPHSQGVELAAVDQSVSISQMIAGWITEAQ